MFSLPELRYSYDALEPAMSEATLRTHHDKHHKAYVDATNKLTAEKGIAGKSLEDVVIHAKSAGDQKLFNQAAQAWNHAFFWECMNPGGSKPSGGLGDAIDAAFGGIDQLKAKFVDAGVDQFASGWVWLVAEADKLRVVTTHDADSALDHTDFKPLIVCDLWEHAYYLDYKNVRKEFLETWFDSIANWAFASKQFDAIKGAGGTYRHPEPIDRAKAA